MSLEIWLDFIRDHFTPETGQILLRSLQQDPLVWQFVKNEKTKFAFFENAPSELVSFSPGKLAVWQVQQTTGIPLSEPDQDDFTFPDSLQTRGAQALETTIHTGLPPADLFTAGLLTLTLLQRKKIKGGWSGISKELFKIRKQSDYHKYFLIWQTPFACLFSLCADFDSLAEEIFSSKEIIRKTFLPIYIHAILANPMDNDQRIAKLFPVIKFFSIDLQLESLKWLNHFHQDQLKAELSKNLIQTKDNRDFFSKVFSEIAAFEAVHPERDPLEKQIRFNLAEDINRIAAFQYYSGNEDKAVETYQKSSDVLEFLKAQTLIQSLTEKGGHFSASRWLEIIKSVPHSKQARFFYIRSLIGEKQYQEAKIQLDDLPPSTEKHLLQSQIEQKDKPEFDSLIKSVSHSKTGINDRTHQERSYYVHPARMDQTEEVFNLIKANQENEISRDWLDRYIQADINDVERIKLARDLFNKTQQSDKAIELSSVLERLEPNNKLHKRNLAQLYAQVGKWDKAYSFLQNLVKSDSHPDVKDLERFAEAALRTEEVDVSLSVCQNILQVEPDNTKALVLLGEGFMKNGDVIKAIQHMESVVKSIPTEPDAWITLAWLWEENGQLDRALETLKKGFERAPNQPKLLRKLGKTQLQQGQTLEALPNLKQAYDLQPNHIEGKLDLVHTYLELDQPQKAYQLLEPYHEDYTDYPIVTRLLGQVLIALEKEELAEPVLLFAALQYPEDLDTVLSAVQLLINRIETNPNGESPTDVLDDFVAILQESKPGKLQSELVALCLADIDRIRGNHKKAFDLYNNLIKAHHQKNPELESRLHYGLGKAAMSLEKQEVALAALQIAMNLQPSRLIIRHALADALLSVNLHEKANTMAKSALRLSPKNLNNILWYAQFNTKNNEPEEAVRALKEALQITPDRAELKLWLSKALISSGALEEAYDEIKESINSDDLQPELLHQAAHTCIHLNDLELAEKALLKASKQKPAIDPVLLMDQAVVYNLMGNMNKALDILNVEPSIVSKHPEIAMLKSHLLCSLGQYDPALKTLESIQDELKHLPAGTSNGESHKITSPLLYSFDLSLKAYHTRLGLLLRAKGNLIKAQEHFSRALKLSPEDLLIRNMVVETAMANLEPPTALKIFEKAEPSGLLKDQPSQDVLDLFCSHVEILLFQNELKLVAEKLNTLPESVESYPRLLALKSRWSAQNDDTEAAQRLISEAEKTYQKNFSELQSQDLPIIFRKISNLYSLGEAFLALDNHREAKRIWQQIHEILDSQPLINIRYLHTLITGAEAQQIANALSIRVHCPGDTFLSQQSHSMAEKLFENLQNHLPQEQLVCLKARIISAFTGKWPLHLNVDDCLLGAEEAAAVILGSQEDGMVKGILESFPDDEGVLQAYGIYALRQKSQDAVPYVEKALKLNTSNPINHALLAHLNLGNPEKALKSIETALTFWPEESEWHSLAADLNTKLGKTHAAEEHIQHAIDNEPTNASFWIQSAMMNIAGNNLEQAKLDLQKSTVYQPEDSQAWAKMAEINRQMGNIPEAINNIRKAVELDPEDDNFPAQEMKYLYDQKDFPELEQKAKEIVEKNHSNQDANIFLAKAQAKQGKFEQALSTLKTAINHSQDHPRLLLEQIKIKKDQVGVETVLPEMINLAQNHAENPQILTTLTEWLIQSKRLDQAEEVAQTSLRTLPEQADLYLMLGRLQRKKGKLDQAISHLSQAITLEPTLVDAYIELGKTYQERRDLEKAIETYQKGSIVNNSDPRPYFHAGLALKECKNYQEAEVMFKEAKKYSPDDANIIRQLGVVTALNLINTLREAK